MRRKLSRKADTASDFDDVRPWNSFYGNGKVYVARGSKLLAVRGANFEAERLDNRKKPWGEFWISSEVVVGLGVEVKRREAIRSLQTVLDALKASK